MYTRLYTSIEKNEYLFFETFRTTNFHYQNLDIIGFSLQCKFMNKINWFTIYLVLISLYLDEYYLDIFKNQIKNIIIIKLVFVMAEKKQYNN